jgi:hypothetical protein
MSICLSIYSHFLDRFEESIEKHKEAQSFAQQHHLYSLNIESNCNIGKLKEYLTKNDEALRHYQEALSV